MLVPPVTFKCKDYNKNNINKLIEILKTQYDIIIHFNPELFCLDIDYQFDSRYHPNKYGTMVRTYNLATCLKNYLENNQYSEIDDKTANKITRELEDIYRPTISPLSDLLLIKHALEQYYNDYKHYPVSKGFDGLYSIWGCPDREWIKGLAPKYIKKLPIDSRFTKEPGNQYLYRSDGQDYKLISHNPMDFMYVIKQKPSLIDPARTNRAYGFWTNGASKW